MTETEKRILKNQYEIMWVLHRLLRKADPDLVGRGGELDRMCDDLREAAEDTRQLVGRS